MWRKWKEKVPVDENLRIQDIKGPTRCWCCNRPNQETLSYVFLRSGITNRTWSYFPSYVGIIGIDNCLRELILGWWNVEVQGRARAYCQSILSMIVWELWKRINNSKHNGNILSTQIVLFNISKNIGLLLKVRNPRKVFLSMWLDIQRELEHR